MLEKPDFERNFGAFPVETWDAFQAIGRKLSDMPPPSHGQNPEDHGDGSGDREPRKPLPRAPLSGAAVLELTITD